MGYAGTSWWHCSTRTIGRDLPFNTRQESITVATLWLMVACCSGPQRSSEGRNDPEPVPRAPQVKGVRVVAAGSPLAEEMVAFTNPATGALIEVTQTNQDGVASASAPSNAVVTVFDDHVLTSFYDLPDGAILDVGLGADRGDGADREIRTSYVAFDGALLYRMSVGCSVARGVRLESPGSVKADESCLGNNEAVDVLAHAYGTDGRALAGATVLDLPLPREGSDVSFSSWTTDLHQVRLEWTDGPGPPEEDIASSLYVGRNGRWFSAQASNSTDGGEPMNAGPSGFGDRVEVRQVHRTDTSTTRRFQREVGLPDVLVVSADVFSARPLSGAYVPEEGAIVTTLDVTSDVPLAVRARLVMVDPAGTTFFWTAIGPVTRARFAAPKLPDTDLSLSVPLEGAMELVSMNAATAAKIDHAHWRVGVRAFLPASLKDADTFLWIVSSNELRGVD